jgi:ABA responsive element binding factor
MATTNGQAHVINSSFDGGANAGLFKGPASGLGPRGSSLARQQSIYSLTLDEFQNALGHDQAKNFGSMNMTEFLENIWSAEEGAAAGKETGGLLRQASLHKQGSINLPRTLTGKTVDEVWRDIHQNAARPAAAALQQNERQRQNTFGEMTLEDFLRKAGVVGDELDIATGGALSSLGATPPSSGAASNPQSIEAQAQQHQAEWMDYQMKQQQQQHKQQQQLSQMMAQQHVIQPGPSLLGEACSSLTPNVIV